MKPAIKHYLHANPQLTVPINFNFMNLLKCGKYKKCKITSVNMHSYMMMLAMLP